MNQTSLFYYKIDFKGMKKKKKRLKMFWKESGREMRS